MATSKQTKQEPEGKLQHVNLKNVRFHSGDKDGTKVDDYENLQKLDFVHCEFNDGHKLYEDTHFHAFPEEQRAGILKRLEYNYRYLRKHYDEKGDYIEGNDFHYNYMEAKRKNTPNLLDKIFLWFYGKMNGYNTKPEYALFWITGIVFISAMIHTWIQTFDLKELYYQSSMKIEMFPYLLISLICLAILYVAVRNITPLLVSLSIFVLMSVSALPLFYPAIGYTLVYFGYAVLYSTINFLPAIKPPDIFMLVNQSSSAITIVENILGPILIALLILSLRNRFRRSKSEDEFK